MYNGQFQKGLLILFGSAIGFLIFIFPGLLVFIYGLYDAYVTARKMNAGEIPFREFSRMQVGIFLLVWLIVAMTYFIFAIGLAAEMIPLPS